MEEDSYLQLHLSVDKNKETAGEGRGRTNAAVYFYVLLFEYTCRLGDGNTWDVIFTSEYIMHARKASMQGNAVLLP